MVKIRLASSVQTDSVVDGPGLRMVIWTQGCPHACRGCHNPQSHDSTQGNEYEISDICKTIKNFDYHDGITFSGGEPMIQASACLMLADTARKLGLTVWCYTGYTFEELLNKHDEDIQEFLKYIDILVDGKFDINSQSLDLKYRGSRNQRCIDVQNSLEMNQVVTIF